MGSNELRTELENLLRSLNIDFVSVEHPEVINLYVLNVLFNLAACCHWVLQHIQ